MTDTKVYFADITSLKDDAIFSEYYAKMPQYRREKIDRCKLRDDKIRSLGAGILQSRALWSFGIDKNIEIEFGKNGKPFLKGIKDVYFNLSHSGDLVMCAISMREIGCDVETVRKSRFGVEKRFFTPEECDFVGRGESEEEKNERFFKIWTLKESLIKANGAGLSLSLGDFSVVSDGKVISSLNFDGKTYVFYEVDTGDEGYKSAICVLGDDGKIEPKVVFENF